MRKGLIVFILPLMILSYGQDRNVFHEPEQYEDSGDNGTHDSGTSASDFDGGEQEEGPGNPGNPVNQRTPIDDYIPLLALAAIGGIIYVVRKRQRQML